MAQKKYIRHHAIVAHFAQRLRDTRRASGMSQQDLARRAKVSTTYIGKLERGESSVGIDMLARLAEALDVELTALLVGATNKAPGIEAVRATIKQKATQLTSRADGPALQAMAVIMGLVDNALARQSN